MILPPTAEASPAETFRPGLEACNVTFTAPVQDSRGSMPLGNGDIGLNVWMEPNGDVLFYLGKSDAWLDNRTMDLVKVGRVRVSLAPSPFAGNPTFRQTLHLGAGEVLLTSDRGSVRIWVDANAPVVRVEASTTEPVVTQVALETWRSQIEKDSFYVEATPDVVLPEGDDRLVWYHRNENPRAWPMLHQTFGGRISGPGLVSAAGARLVSERPDRQSSVAVVVLAERTDTAAAWVQSIERLSARELAISAEVARVSHRAWWQGFWDRSWIEVSGDADAETVTRGYALQRFITACAGRGRYPIKFNGSLFVVDNPDRTQTRNGVPEPAPLNADERLWGGQYWVQNTRAMYWPRLAAGDFDILRPLFRMYGDILRANEAAVRRFYNHPGSYIAECAPYWGGIPELKPDTPGTHTVHYFSPALELIALGLDYHAHTQDEVFLRETVLPMASMTLAFYEHHFPRDANGKLAITDANAAEAYWKVNNPLPDIAGLHWVTDRLLRLPEHVCARADRASWERIRALLPPIPVGERAGTRSLVPFDDWTPEARPHTPENPELYAVYPFRHYGLGKPDLELALDTFRTRLHQGSGCWRQDGPQAALLGLASEAKTHVVANFSAREPRLAFPGFWGDQMDYAPDQDNGGNGELALQWMLMQCEGRTIRLLPAWPSGWDADFKLAAPGRTTVQASVRDGRITALEVAPESRRADVVIGLAQTTRPLSAHTTPPREASVTTSR